MTLTNVYIRIVLIQTLLLFAVACAKDAVPSLNITHTTVGLELTLTGSTFIEDGVISEVSINWGDGKNTKLQDGNFDSFEQTHRYSEPSTYVVTIVSTDSNGVATSESISVLIDFKEVVLDNIKETMFKTSDSEYLILTLNLHTYQEEMQNQKFNTITELIGKMDIDFIAFQECAQNKSAVIVDGIVREDNMALIITNNLKEKFDAHYSYIWDWAHYGWTVWEEGIAVLSKHPLTDTESRYISSNVSTTSITSRKALYGSYEIPEGKLNFFSVHTHWRTSETDNEHNNQIKSIQQMADQKNVSNPSVATFVCGDFNVNPTSSYPWSEGYHTMINNNEYIDTFGEVYTDANDSPRSIYNTVGGTYPGRIDYIFMKNESLFKVLDSQIIFTSAIIGKVSDHSGVLTKISVK